ncbi:hypothetical protein GF358_04345 [Candidatus Woesearchaeota archaeon]|nr:hypothetical protein [Candidatus Woesearchaeota archaeon]
MSERIIWQPTSLYGESYNFRVLLDPEFAREMCSSKLTRENYQNMQNLPRKLMNFSGSDPYIFHEDTCFVRQINVRAGDGKWLAVDGLEGRLPDFSEPINYSTHNIDYPSEALDLMRLFDLWIEYSDLLKEKR